MRAVPGLGKPRPHHPLPRAGPVQVPGAPEETGRSSHGRSQHGAAQRHSQKPSGLEDSGADRLGHSRDIPTPRGHHRGHVQPHRGGHRQQLGGQGVLRGSAQAVAGNLAARL